MKLIIVGAAAATLALAAACGGNADSGGKPVLPTATSSQQAEALASAQQVVGQCVAHEHTIHSIIECVAPAGRKDQFKACALAAVSREHITTKEGRRKLYQEDWPNCVVQVQASGTPTPARSS